MTEKIYYENVTIEIFEIFGVNNQLLTYRLIDSQGEEIPFERYISASSYSRRLKEDLIKDARKEIDCLINNGQIKK